MRDDSEAALPERSGYLVLLATAPAIWMTHFLLSYITASIWCAKYAGPGNSLAGARIAVAAYTVVALAVIGYVGWSGHRRHRHGGETEPHDFDSAADRHRFLGFATLLLAGLSAIATIFVAVSVAAFETCR
jgi:hypothetical protein